MTPLLAEASPTRADGGEAAGAYGSADHRAFRRRLRTATPFAFWWLAPATVCALGLVFIAAVYIGFSVADGR